MTTLTGSRHIDQEQCDQIMATPLLYDLAVMGFITSLHLIALILELYTAIDDQ
jgi:hypothetical protein